MNSQTKYKPYIEIITQFRTSEVRTQCIPVEHYISLLMPTLLHGNAAYASFTCPQQLFPKPGYGKPFAWMLFSATTGVLQAFIPCALHSFTNKTSGAVEEEQGSQSISLAEALEKSIQNMIQENAPRFFKNEAPAADTGRQLLLDLNDFVGPALMPVYKSLAPDFLSWLES